MRVLCNRTVLRRHWGCRPREICVARRARQLCGSLCRHRSRHVRQRSRVCRRIGNGQQKAGPGTPRTCRHPDCDLVHIRNPAGRHEHQPATNIRLSTSRQLLARAVDIFPCSLLGHAGGWRVLFASSRRRRSVLRQTPPRQQQTLHLPPITTGSLIRGKATDSEQVSQRGEHYANRAT